MYIKGPCCAASQFLPLLFFSFFFLSGQRWLKSNAPLCICKLQQACVEIWARLQVDVDVVPKGCAEESCRLWLPIFDKLWGCDPRQ